MDDIVKQSFYESKVVNLLDVLGDLLDDIDDIEEDDIFEEEDFFEEEDIFEDEVYYD